MAHRKGISINDCVSDCSWDCIDLQFILRITLAKDFVSMPLQRLHWCSHGQLTCGHHGFEFGLIVGASCSTCTISRTGKLYNLIMDGMCLAAWRFNMWQADVNPSILPKRAECCLLIGYTSQLLVWDLISRTYCQCICDRVAGLLSVCSRMTCWCQFPLCDHRVSIWKFWQRTFGFF